jgi:hypothetical protein
MAAYPLVEFVLTVGGWDTEGEALPDTAFEGGLAIPVGVGREIVADPARTELVLADASLVRAPSWDGYLELEEHSFRVEVVALGSAFLIGREVLDQLEICFEYGERVRLRFRD